MGNVEIPCWLEALPLAPEFRPTDTEFADPIAYISKIENECNAFGICKIIPPLPKPSKKYVFNNLNKSLLKCPELGSSSRLGSSDVDSDGEVRAVFTTRQQQLGQSAKKSKASVLQNSSLGGGGAHKQVWQSGEIYTLEQFESKSKVFSKTQLGTIKDVTPLVIEAMFWKAASEKPIYLEYANDVPGSGFGEPEGQIRYFHRRRRKRNFFTRTGEDDSPKNESETCLDDVSKATTSSQKKSHQSSCCYDKEGTAGWKISNSPWNLQVISRSPGSLTRFMPDDIPGVTSPMVYIGMLFSWFAWHVEDHELHSMNFLHTGSSKTWYSIPGDYAFAFEEVVRTEAYGANVDRIAALSLLGQKTTVMSPEVVVASGIPCCRLIQNPGEFVVTFPRAYHIGFSHGFNCGEAANFGTPQWLSVAKEAAVRRAAMNYLPMLSHQQLLYLLTMSFVSRVPRSLLPGVRSSRLRDRQKEEREFLVKKAFIEDILHENNTLSVLLGKDSGYRAILWNQDLLTCPNKETIPPSEGATVDAISTEKPSHSSPENHSNEHTCLLEEMSLYMENLNDLYLGSDDLSCDFQVDSGTLACVACGILGFPFMSVVQPSEKASLKLVQEFPGTSGYLKPCSSSDSVSFPENPSTISNSLSEMNVPQSSITKSRNGWNIHDKFLRPRSFCLEHAVEIVELLQCKGGANVLVICHSDYQKIKAHATTIAEEVGNPFRYNEVPLDTASKEDLNMIDLAIEDGVHKENGEDWTSKLGINLRHCVKIRKNSASKQVQHALTLGGLFSNKCQASNFPVIGWKLRRSRSRKIYLPLADSKPHETTESKNNDALVGKSSLAVKKEVKLIQYSRRNSKTKRGGSSGICKISGSTVALSNCEQSKVAPGNKTQNVGSSTSVEFSPSIQTPKETSEQGLKFSIQSVETRASEEMNTVREAHCSVELADSGIERDGADEVREKHNASLLVHSTEESIEIREEKLAVEQFDNEACDLASEGNSKVPSDENVLVISDSYPGNEETSNDQVLDLVPVYEKLGSCITDHTLASVKEFSEGQHETSSAEESSNVKPLQLNEPIVINEPLPVSTEVSSQILDKEPRHNVGTLDENTEELSSAQRENSPREPTLSDLTSGNCSLTKNHSIPTGAKESDEDRSVDDSLTFEDSMETETSFNRKHEIVKSSAPEPSPKAVKGIKRSRELELLTGNKSVCNSFIRSPCEGLRSRVTDIQHEVKEKPGNKMNRPPRDNCDNSNKKKEKERPAKAHKCDIESCRMSFDTKAELSQHKRNRCPREGCGKRFRSHKYAMVHERVHGEERPLKCPWKGCSMSFKWSWARTEHIRVHTGEKPYKCKVEGCGLSFRFVSDFSRHRRKTGHCMS